MREEEPRKEGRTIKFPSAAAGATTSRYRWGKGWGQRQPASQPARPSKTLLPASRITPARTYPHGTGRGRNGGRTKRRVKGGQKGHFQCHSRLQAGQSSPAQEIR